MRWEEEMTVLKVLTMKRWFVVGGGGGGQRGGRGSDLGPTGRESEERGQDERRGRGQRGRTASESEEGRGEGADAGFEGRETGCAP